jgi:hypothetical protein
VIFRFRVPGIAPEAKPLHDAFFIRHYPNSSELTGYPTH